jgi:hypothetical protein
VEFNSELSDNKLFKFDKVHWFFFLLLLINYNEVKFFNLIVRYLDLMQLKSMFIMK